MKQLKEIKQIYFQKKPKAFSLIELSVVLTIMAIIISGAVTVSTTAIRNAKIEKTQEKLEKIETALNVYVCKNGKLPCPASMHKTTSDSDYATSLGTDGNCTDSGQSGIYVRDGYNLVQGALPAVTLGLSRDFTIDEFGNKFAYKVSKKATSSSTFNTFNTSSNNERIRISEYVNSSTLEIADGIYAVTSHGSNGKCAVHANMSSDVSVPTSIADGEGNQCPQDHFSVWVYISSEDAEFDDITIYRSRDTIQYEISPLSSCI